MLTQDKIPTSAARSPIETQSQLTPTASRTQPAYVVLTGNPNCGKTTVFNALTGLRARVGNYAGVTVERKEGKLQGAPTDLPITVLDLPGTYSLSPQSLDEQVARDVLFHRLKEVPAACLVIVVVDASNLERNLYFATQVIELGYPTVIGLNMVDVAENNGQAIDAEKLSDELGVPVLPLVGNTGKGIPELRSGIVDFVRAPQRRTPKQFYNLPAPINKEIEPLSDLLAKTFYQRHTSAHAEALLILSDEKFLTGSASHYPTPVVQSVEAARKRIDDAELDWRSAAIEARYLRIAAIQQSVVSDSGAPTENFSDKLDRVVTHRIWGMLIFIAIMAVMFLSIFTLARIPMDLLQSGVNAIGDTVANAMPQGDLRDLLVNGVIQGVGAVVVFLPQICLLFLFIGLLEDTGYMARAAFLMDRLMSKVGLHGKSFIPMLSSFACAIPGIMATRTIETPKDRLVTILVAPLMSCSARLPVYILLIAAMFPDRQLLASLTMLSMYLLGIVVALLMAWLFKKTLLKGETPMLVMELPPYKRPLARIVVRHMWDRSKLFLRKAGTVILGINILLWFLASYPRHEAVRPSSGAATSATQPATGIARTDNSPTHETQDSGERVRNSFAGMAGRAIEPIIRPLGFDWKMGIGLVSSFAAREVFVSTMSIVYNVAENRDKRAHTRELAQVLREQKRPNGLAVYTTLTCLSLMVFYVLAMQCISTVAVVRRETNSWKWPLFQWVYMGVLAWTFAFIVYQGGHLLGFQ
jgi:ferrous iron transport protein B